MKVLIVEDEFDKREKIKSFVNDFYSRKVEIIECESLRSGLRALTRIQDFNMVLLDMSMPGFDITDDEPGGGPPESYAGMELMAQMRLRNINTPVVVITQYKKFDSGTVGLDELTSQFKEKYPNIFIGTVYFSSAVEGWKKELSEHLRLQDRKEK